VQLSYTQRIFFSFLPSPRLGEKCLFVRHLCAFVAQDRPGEHVQAVSLPDAACCETGQPWDALCFQETITRYIFRNFSYFFAGGSLAGAAAIPDRGDKKVI